MATFSEMNEKREAVQALIVRASGIGELAKAEQKALRSVYKIIVSSMLAACPEEHKAELQSVVAESNSYQKTFANPFVAQVNRKDTPIKSEELIASLLGEDLETIRIMVKLLPKDSRVGLAEEASMLIERARKEGHTVLQSAEKLKAFEENAPD